MVCGSRNIITTVERIKSYSPSKLSALRSTVAISRLVSPSAALIRSILAMLMGFLSHAVTL